MISIGLALGAVVGGVLVVIAALTR